MSTLIDWENLPRLQGNNLPPRAYYNLTDAATILECKERDILHYAATDRLEIVASVAALEVSALLYTPDDQAETDRDEWPQYLDFFYIPSSAARNIETAGKVSLASSGHGYLLDSPFGIEASPSWESEFAIRCTYHFFGNEAIEDDDDFEPRPVSVTVTPEAVYVMAPELARFKQGQSVLPEWPANNQAIGPESTRTDGIGRVIGALAAGYLGSTDQLESKAGEILRSLQDTQNKGGLSDLRLPSEKTLRRYLSRAAQELQR